MNKSYFNVSETNKMRLLVLGKTQNPRAVGSVTFSNIYHQGQKKAWVAKKICKDWFYSWI